MKFKWNNMLRNILLRYLHEGSQRRGFVYYLSRPAVKFIQDIVEEQTKKGGSGGASGLADVTGAKDIEDRIRKILQDGKKFVSVEGTTTTTISSEAETDTRTGLDTSRPTSSNKKEETHAMEDLSGGLSAEFTPQNNYHLRLVAPQIQLQSDKNRKHVVLVTAKAMQLKVVEVFDKARLSDEVSGLVQRRLLLGMDSTQFFVTHRKWFLTRAVSAYAGTSYGARRGRAGRPGCRWRPWWTLRGIPLGSGAWCKRRRPCCATTSTTRCA